MYERFTDRARKVMQLANHEANRYGEERIDSEYVLLGLVKEGNGVAARVLRSFGVDVMKVRAGIGKPFERMPEPSSVEKLPQTQETKRIIEFALLCEARDLQHHYVGTEHILLGLMRDAKGRAAQMLANLGLNLEEVRAEVLSVLGHLPTSHGTSDP